MLYFCSVEDIKGVMASASRYDTQYDDMRKAVTEDMNTYMRRTLDYETGIVEFFDTHNVETSGSFNIWLGKRNIEPASLAVNYSLRREWSDENVLDPLNIVVNAAKGKITVPGFTRPGSNTLRVMYNGGFKAIGATDVMDCPSVLKNAAVTECVFRLDKLLNLNVGNTEDVDKKQRVAQRKFIGGLLAETANSLTEYRKPLGGVF